MGAISRWFRMGSTDARPEIGAGGFSKQDGTVEFYGRVRALTRATDHVVDYGAGRGKFLDEPVSYRRDLQFLRGDVTELVGVDIDDAVLENPAVDRGIVLTSGNKIDLPSSSIDLVVSDFTFEHVSDPQSVVAEIDRVLRPGGWVCARTPNRWGVVGIATRSVPNHLHVSFLRRLQPEKKCIDTFPTKYLMNSRRQISELFVRRGYRDCSYFHETDPGYAGGSLILWRFMRTVEHLLPDSMKSTFLVFVQKAE